MTLLERDIRRNKKVETGLCKELDKTLKDLGNLTNRCMTKAELFSSLFEFAHMHAFMHNVCDCLYKLL